MADQEDNGKIPAHQSWREIAHRTWDKLFEFEIFGRCAQFAYYWFFSLFPLLILLTALLAYLPITGNLDRWVNALSKVLPPDAFTLVRSTFYEVIRQRRHGLLSFSILAVIWASSSGMGVLISSLNKTFDSAKERPWWRERLLAVILTLGLASFIIAALMLIFFGDYISANVARAFGYSATLRVVWSAGQWLVVIAFVLIGVELIYHFAPTIKQKWTSLTPGAVFALVFWLSISYGLRLYVTRITNYSATYGALGGVMVLMLWLYLLGMAILVGGVINAVVRSE